MHIGDINLYILVAITALVFFAVFGDWSLVVGVVVALLACAALSGEGFEGREIRLSESCQREEGVELSPDVLYSRWINRAYDTCDKPAAVDFNCNTSRRLSCDEKSMRYNQLRGRNDRRMMDGVASRNQYSYMKVYGDELVKSEAKRWDGALEY